MNVRDREFPDRRAARRRAPPAARVDRRRRSLVARLDLLGNLACGLRRQPIRRRARPAADAGPAGHAISPGIAIGPVVVLDRAGCGCRPARSPTDAVAGELERLDRGLESARDGGRPRRGRGPRRGSGPQYADILAAHCRMIADPTLRRDARKLIERRADLRRARRSRCARGLCLPAGTALRLAPGGSRRRCPRHRGADPQPLDRRAARVVPGRAGGADDRAGARPDSQ